MPLTLDEIRQQLSRERRTSDRRGEEPGSHPEGADRRGMDRRGGTPDVRDALLFLHDELEHELQEIVEENQGDAHEDETRILSLGTGRMARPTGSTT